ncbi:MAG: leucine-rich repeat protein, partial [Clostridia bacterium]|nr:leucine-rich repeat protein [Clostridia bacterium]
MKKSKKIALIILAVMLMAVCFVFGVSAAEPTFEDYVNAGVIKSSYQTIIRIRLNGCMANQPTRVYDFESGTFVNKHESEITDYYDIVPESSSEMRPYEKVALPYLTIPADLYSDGWYCVNTDSYLEGRTYEITYDDCGKIVEIVAANQPQYTEGNFSYIVTDGKAEIVKARGFEDGRVVIPDTLGGYEVKNIRAYAFNDVYEEFYVSEDNNYFSVDESGALFNKDKTKIFAYPSLNPQTSYKVPDSVEIIGTCAFVRALYLKNLELPENLRIIEEQGIRSCWFALEEIYLSSKVEKLEEAAIYDMPFLKKIYIEGYDTELIGERVVGFIEMYFTDDADKDLCADLYARYAQGDEEALYELANYMEQPAESYYKATIYTHGGSKAWNYAANKNEIPNEQIHFYKGEWLYDDFYNDFYRKCIYCHTCERKDMETFTDGYFIYAVLNNEAILKGGTDDLKGDVVIPSTLGGYPVVEIAVGAFYKNATITSVVIPDGVRRIGRGAFEKCRSTLKKVVMTDSVTELGAGAFMECYNLEEVVLSNNIEVIGSYTFEMCYSLKELKLPEKLREFYGISLTGCASLKELIFPESVELIEGYSMMASSLSVEKIVIGSKAKDAGDNNQGTFGELVSLKDFYVYSPDYDPEDSGLGYVSIAPKGMPKDEWIALYVEAVRELDHHHNTSEKLEKVMEHTEMFEPRISDILTIHAVHDSKTEIYAKENGIKFEYIHDF